jgi:hypothetical protein
MATVETAGYLFDCAQMSCHLKLSYFEPIKISDWMDALSDGHKRALAILKLRGYSKWTAFRPTILIKKAWQSQP